MKKRSIFLGILILLCFFIIGCGKKKDSDPLSQITIGYFPNITHAQALIMKAQGILEKKFAEEFPTQDIFIKWVAFNAGPNEVQALFADEIDIGYMGPVPAISANVTSEGDIRVLAGASNAGAVLLANAKLEQTEGLEWLSGKTIAVPQLGNTQHLCLLALLEEYGLKQVSEGGTVTIVAVANADMEAMMFAEEIEAAFVAEPWGTRMENSGAARIALDYDEIWNHGNYPVALVVARSGFINNQKRAVEIFLEVHREITKQLLEKPEQYYEEINQEMAKVSGSLLDQSVLEKAFSRLKITDKVKRKALDAFAIVDKKEGFIYELPGENLMFHGL